MRISILHHGACFDGAVSAALFAELLEAIHGSDTLLRFVPKFHRPGEVYNEADFAGDAAGIVDFRYSTHENVRWFFDHHPTAFQLAGEREHYDANRLIFKHYDTSAPSCATLVAEVAARVHRVDLRGHFADLLGWAEHIDSASFPSPQHALDLEPAAMQLMAFVEQIRDETLAGRFICDLRFFGRDGEHGLARLAREPYITRVVDPIRRQLDADVNLLAERCRRDGDVVTFDLTDQAPRTYNKFIPYLHHPDAPYVVGLSRGLDERIRLSAGYNPWLPGELRGHNLADMCERFDGGGHPFVGGASFPAERLGTAREAQRHIAGALGEAA